MATLIQNYANTTKKYYNNLSDANSDNLLKPLDGKGYLVNNTLTNAPVELAKDTYYTAKALKKGVSGKANDHELGKLNDLGLKLGGLTIATYLMTKRSSLKAKAMEFIGFGAFLASMSLWPKVALQWPAQLIHGVNFRKQYVDEQGRKKYFSQDPNYIPFDLMKDKNLDETAKEHIRKVSVQNNTMWMLTAGVATPVMTALACNFAEKHVGKWAEKYTDNKINNLAGKLESYNSGNKTLENELVVKNLDKTSEVNLENILKAKKGGVVTEADVDKISKALTSGLDTQTTKAAHTDLRYMLVADKTLVNNETVSDIATNLTKKIDTRYGEGFTASVIDSKKLSEHIEGFMQVNGDSERRVLSADKSEELRLSIGKFIEKTTSENGSLSQARKNRISEMASETVQEVFESKKVAVLSEDAATNISKAGRIVRKFRALDETISSATHFKVEKAPETLLGNNWGEVTEVLIKELKISNKELVEAKGSEELTAQLFTKKLEEIAKDETRYKKMVRNVANKMAELDEKLDNSKSGKRPVMDILLESTEKNCENTAKELNSVAENGSKPFFNLANRINAKEVNYVKDGNILKKESYVGTIREAKVQRIKQARVGSVKNAYMRLLHTMDFFKRAAENKDFSGNKELDKEIIAKGKKLLMSSHSGDFFLKFQTANNVDFYKALMWHTFNSGKMSDSTASALNEARHEVFTGGAKSTMAQRVTKWAQRVGNLMGTTRYDFLPNHIEGNDTFKDVEKTAVEKFNQIACTPDNLLYNALKQKFNSNKWLKIWGTVGAIVLTGTLASQFAFGKKESTIQTTK